jgi:hypothetical protein
VKKGGKPDDGFDRLGPRNSEGALPRRGFKIDVRRFNGKIGKTTDSKRACNRHRAAAPRRQTLGERPTNCLGVDNEREKNGECGRNYEKTSRKDAEPS